MKHIIILFVSVFILSLVNAAVPEECLNCICYASSDCNPTTSCDSSTCGPYHITWGYWADAGKFTLSSDSPWKEGAWMRCVKDMECAARTIEGYMAKFEKDCNGDGIVDCLDYAMIHKNGGYNCVNPLQGDYGHKFNQCYQDTLNFQLDVRFKQD